MIMASLNGPKAKPCRHIFQLFYPTQKSIKEKKNCISEFEVVKFVE